MSNPWNVIFSLPCSEAVGWVTGRASVLWKAGCWFVGGDELTGTLRDLQLQLSPPPPSSSAPTKFITETFQYRLTHAVLEDDHWNACRRRNCFYFCSDQATCNRITQRQHQILERLTTQVNGTPKIRSLPATSKHPNQSNTKISTLCRLCCRYATFHRSPITGSLSSHTRLLALFYNVQDGPKKRDL